MLVDKRLLFFKQFAIVKLMVKLRVGKKKQAALKDSGIVTSEFKKVQRLPHLPKINWTALRTKRGMAIAAILLVLIAGIVAAVVWAVQESRKPPVTKLQTEQTFVTNTIDGLEQDAPPENASKQEQLQYYDKLQNYYDLAGNYKKAAEIFEKRAGLESSDLDYMDYGRASKYYSETGDKTRAIAALDKAISILPTTANEETGYDPVLVKESLERAKQELQK